ncbi:uncharacterized protein LOC122526806 isoform X1 [Frieseomelitta varia]|uniref:uncharacterized protein LOC122526806 isoform X1 n=1 Tax=Frieseomelitta varia TaxID=561572 RepID=UPI001CB6AACE|nr:uncharacterized protein LOC122526806 isoform X1 [Frieseomelitta varia]
MFLITGAFNLNVLNLKPWISSFRMFLPKPHTLELLSTRIYASNHIRSIQFKNTLLKLAKLSACRTSDLYPEFLKTQFAYIVIISATSLLQIYKLQDENITNHPSASLKMAQQLTNFK